MSEIPDLEAIRAHRDNGGRFVSGGEYGPGWDSVWLEMEGGEALDALLAYVPSVELARSLAKPDSPLVPFEAAIRALLPPALDEANQQGPG